MAVPLYDDLEPVQICGYASVFNVLYDLAGTLERIAPGAFNLGRYETAALFAHEHDWRIGWTRDRSLQLWQDSFGLAFRLDVPATHGGLGLVQGIRANNFRECSFHNADDRAVAFDVVNEGGREVHVVRRININELSICPAGRNPEAVCWLDAEDPEDLPPHVRHARAQWLKGRVAVQLAARAARAARVQARARAVHQVPGSVRAVLAAGKPTAWLAGAEAFARGRRKRPERDLGRAARTAR
jgi:HK97 family phage prohead protease